MVGLLHLLDPLQVVKKLIGCLVDGPAGGQLFFIALCGINGVTGGEDGAVVVGFQHHTDDARGVGSLNEEFQVLRQLGRLPNGLKLNPLHIEQRPDVRPAVAGHHTPVGVFQVRL